LRTSAAEVRRAVGSIEAGFRPKHARRLPPALGRINKCKTIFEVQREAGRPLPTAACTCWIAEKYDVAANGPALPQFVAHVTAALNALMKRSRVLQAGSVDGRKHLWEIAAYAHHTRASADARCHSALHSPRIVQQVIAQLASGHYPIRSWRSGGVCYRMPLCSERSLMRGTYAWARPVSRRRIQGSRCARSVPTIVSRTPGMRGPCLRTGVPKDRKEPILPGAEFRCRPISR
jgi:hypothetical protein